MRVPLVDLGWQRDQIAEDVRAGWAHVLDTTAFVLGPHVAQFEEELAFHSGVRHCVGVANGTDALELALRAAGVRPGDEVVLPANTFIATALAVVRAGAAPVLVDVEEETQLIDPERVEAALTRRTRAIVPVHLFGQAADVEALRRLAAGRGVAVVEDHAQSHGARRWGRPAGSLGLAAATSFYPGKNLGAFGDGGAVLTDDEELARKLRALRNYGSEVKYHHPEPGFNSRLDTLQAVVLLAKLARLDDWNARRRRAARRYRALLGDMEGVRLPVTSPCNEHVWHLYVVRVPARDEALAALHAAGVGAGVHYPVPVHLQGAMRGLGHGPGDFPVAERLAGEILSLPIYPGITAEQQELVAEGLRAAVPA